jgi:intracellular sulfur oxidation DsrE/DsrF family protein
MKRLFRNGAAVIAALMGLAGGAFAQTLPLPDAPVAKDIAGAKELPDPNMTYKVVFDIAKAADKVDEVNPALTAIARFVNTLAKNGVQADHRKIAVVMHQQGTPIVLNNEAFRARNQGHDNPNIAMIQQLAKAGVDFRVCGQAVLASKIDPKTIQPEIELDLWALTTIVNLEMRGYVRVGAN